MRIVLIGPTHPFRGGIAHYTTLLCRALRREHEVKFISFKRQYPRILFPGSTDRDESALPVTVEGVQYIIDSLNPLTWMSAIRAVTKYEPQILVLPWWVAFWAAPFWSMMVLAKRRLSCEIVVICHNVIEHEENLLKQLATRAVLSRADRLITHSREETRKAGELLGNNLNIITAFHPSYADLSPVRYPKEEAKEKLGFKGDVILFFGFVREYKGLDVLIEAMPAILHEKKVTLLIAGEFWKGKAAYLEQIDRCGIGPHVRIIDRYIPNEELGLYFGAADLVVQPYVGASGSGVCQLAFGFDRPVVGSRIGSIAEVVEDNVNGRLVAPGDPQELAQAVSASLEPATLHRYSANAERTKERFSWEKLADIVVGAGSAST
ncbi:MAG: glycosyltransferase [Candidatus Abyssobacteria bacterium SURF_17]|uniref:Glycosyltransferase n=1 Tax=Candidatus Abyssobacteria bacterium SURF_17 TaxID=2093361 RepID=A0A419EW59_9BACT|nr:MAG: glycosyltransferase [Candidatus Abyssubacteria bacterium SURF_17]